MKILKRKISKRYLLKWAAYLLAAYLLASWGVSGTVNPLLYIHNTQRERLDMEEEEDGLAMELPQDGRAGMGFLSFRIAEAKDYSFRLKLAGYTVQDEVQEMEITAWKGWNVVDLGDYQWKKIVVRQEIMEQNGLAVEDAGLSEHRKADTGGMLSVFASFVFLAAFWECVCWIRDRYAE